MAKDTYDYPLKNIDPDDLYDYLLAVETSLNIRFVGNELTHIATFGELLAHIVQKIQLTDSDDCTTQQAFYQLRNAISSTVQIDLRSTSPGQHLTALLPRQNRRSSIQKIENQLGYKLHILRPARWMISVLVGLFFISLAGLFFNPSVGLAGLLLSIAGFWLAHKTRNEFHLETLGQVAKKMTREHYLQSRRNTGTFNKKEVTQILSDWFFTDFSSYSPLITPTA